jgi:hypothetical protein
LIQRIEAAVGAAGTEAVRQRLGRVAELRTRQVANGWAEVWVVEDVEELASEAELHSFSEMKLSLEPVSGFEDQFVILQVNHHRRTGILP